MSADGQSRVIRVSDEGGWEGVEPRAYKEGEGAFLDVVRHTLLGGPERDDTLAFELRYFEVGPGGYSSLEHHAHPHAVVVVRGRGRVRLGQTTEPIGVLDVVYVAPHTIHRFEADSEEPLGFLCVVDRNRDRPVAVSE